MMQTCLPRLMYLLLVLPLMSLLPACDRNNDQQDDTSKDAITIQAWAHAGQAAERLVLKKQVEQFNQQTDDIDIELTFVPERDYNAQVQAAALAGDLPDILEFDGPYLYNYIWQQQLLPLETLLPAAVIDDLLPSIVVQGTYGQHLYSVGVFDSGLGLYARKSALSRINARIPQSAADAWRIAEFNNILLKLAQQDDDGAVLDLKLNYGGEWFTYGFSPVLQSAGADLIDRDSYQHSRGVLNSDAAIAALQYVQSWIQNGRVDPNLDDAAFVSGRVALSWVGHWEYSRYKQAWQDDLVILPLPDFGEGSRTGQGSWNWGITTRCAQPQAAAEFIRFLLQTDQVLAMSNVNGAVPGTRSAVQRSASYGEKGELHLFADQLLQGVAVPRPRTPAYPIITTAFQQAFQQIRNGANVKQALDKAATIIDQDIRDNQGYPFLTE
ncbi:MAG: sugar ABC transporter substrate-binding protein [Gammaproteobacteria bacterium]|nr:sugar ABC transporter substrate-binding protein [Gammaproteobacteria bacterium]